MKFEKATRKKAKLRLALTGPSGSGKTYGALLIAKGLGGKTAVIDTERGSASLYSHLMEFDTLELLPPFSPERYIEAINAAASAGYETLIIDSATHEWSGTGGCLELNETIANSKFRGNTWSAWNETTPRHRSFIDAMVQAPMHIIATGRSKTETAQQQNDGGKKSVVKLGLKTEQRDGFEYEFTVVLDIIHAGHYAIASKDRTGLFQGMDAKQLSPQVGADLLAWLNDGAVVASAFINPDQLTVLQDLAYDLYIDVPKYCEAVKIQSLAHILAADFDKAVAMMEKKRKPMTREKQEIELQKIADEAKY
jgi:AAA domain